MKICAISDIHGNLLSNIPDCDILCITGDIINLNDQRNLESSRMWWYNRFTNWINKQPCKKVIVIPGNHDFLIEDAYKNKYLDEMKKDLINRTNDKLSLLVNEKLIYNNINFYGCPFIEPIEFQEDKWAFSTTDKELYKIPEDTDILLSHDNPYKNNRLSHNLPKNLKLNFYGHWHDGIDDPKSGYYNCSILTDRYSFKKNYNYVLINFDKHMKELTKEQALKIEELKNEIKELDEALNIDRNDENSEVLDKYAKLRNWLNELIDYIYTDVEAEDIVEWNTNIATDNADTDITLDDASMFSSDPQVAFKEAA